MTRLRSAAAAMIVAAAVAGAANTAEAAPANLGLAPPPAAGESDVAPVRHWQRRCWPVHRWVWTHWGWRYRYVGHRCAPRHRYYYGYPRYRYRPWH